MHPAAEYLQPFIRRQRIVFRIDTVLHALFLIPVVTLFQSRFSWSDTDIVIFVVFRVMICGGAVALGLFANRALLRSWRTPAVLPIVGSVLWIGALPLMSAFYIYLVHGREFPSAGVERLKFSEGFSIGVEVWFLLLAVMTFYKFFYLFTVQQYRKWSRISEEGPR